MNLEKYSDYEINRLLMILDNYEERWLNKNPNNVKPYLEEFDLLMPLSMEYNVNINKLEDEEGFYYSATISNMSTEYSNDCISDNESMLRAVALCILKKHFKDEKEKK